ncbi:OR5V1 protein, partial [Hylia prasina]|nr:OR5V1 protein [Hylia prasina]
ALHPQATISYSGCLAQMFFPMWCAGAECALLAVMAYVRYAAVCQSLRYAQALSRSTCATAAAGCWLWGLLHSALHALLAARLLFRGAARLRHIFCDVPPLLGAACSDTRPNELALNVS